jgi:XamI restriction endonuclease
MSVLGRRSGSFRCLGRAMINRDKPDLWKEDINASVDQFNKWFMKFAPKAYRDTRIQTTQRVEQALIWSKDLADLTEAAVIAHPGILPTLRMCCCPPLARDRLIGLAGVSKALVGAMEEGVIPPRMARATVDENVRRITGTLSQMLDIDIFPWLGAKKPATRQERHRASTIVADRLCGAVSDPIIRNAQEKRQLALIGNYLKKKGYRQPAHPPGRPPTDMETGTFAFRMNDVVGDVAKVRIPIDIVIQPRAPRPNRLPILIEAKSAGDFTNVNKRRKEEATKMRQLRVTFGAGVEYLLFLCGYFDAGYLGYEAAEGIDWVWEHRITDLDQLGI